MGQRGSATILSLVVFFFLVTLLSGMYLLLSNETKLTARTSELIQAQYAAEGGIKRVAAEFRREDDYQWDWLDSAAAVAKWNNYTTDNTQQYHVSIALASAPTIPITPPTEPPTTDVTYRVTAVGRVGDTEKTVVADITVTPPVSDNPVFDNSIATLLGTTFDDDAKDSPINPQKTSEGLKGLCVSNKDIKNLLDGDKKPWLEKDAKTKITLPSFAAMSSIRNPNRPVITIESLGKGCYSYNEGTNTYTIKNNAKIENATLIVDGDLKFESGSTNNASIFVNGNLTIEPAINYNGANLIVVKGDIVNKASNSLQGIEMCYGKFTGPNNVNGGCLIANEAYFTGHSNINFNWQNVQDALVGGDVTMVNIANWRIR